MVPEQQQTARYLAERHAAAPEQVDDADHGDDRDKGGDEEDHAAPHVGALVGGDVGELLALVAVVGVRADDLGHEIEGRPNDQEGDL